MSSNVTLRALAALAAAAAAPAMAQDAGAGEAIFKQRCQSCHAAPAGQPHGVGPNLAGVVGRKAASTAFAYSSALKGSGLTWDKPTLDRFLSGPSKMVPGTRMLISVPDPKERAGLIAYLGGLK